MNFDSLQAEQEAAQSFVDLVATAKKCQQLHERAGMTLPESLKRFFAISTNGKKPTANVPAPERPPLPEEAESDWVSIRVEDAYPTNLALALLRAVGGSMPAGEIVAGVMDLLPNVKAGSIYNLGTRLDSAGVIKKSKEGWELINLDHAPILYEGLIWGPRSVFNKHELAAHRRDAIFHVLRMFKSGLQTSQIIDVLANCAWVHAPVNKELVQGDIELLSKANKIKRRGNSRKWEAVK